MAFLHGIVLILLVKWSTGQDPPPPADLVGDAAVIGNPNAAVDVNTGANADVGVGANVGVEPAVEGAVLNDPGSLGGANIDGANVVDKTNVEGRNLGGAAIGGNTVIGGSTVGGTVEVGTGTGNARGSAAVTTTVNRGGTVGRDTAVGGTVNVVNPNARTTTSGGRIRVANRDNLSASAQNRRPRLPDVTHAVCLQNCLNALHKSSHHCLFASNDDCQRFVICYKHGGTWFGYSYFCPFGKFWYDHACVGFADYQCGFDRCALDSSLSSYRDRSLQYVDPNLNCRTYWQCQNGKSFPYCCPNGQAYQEGLGCVDDGTCRDWCCPRNQIFVEGIGCREMPYAICYEKCCPADIDYGSCVADHICLEDCVRDLNYQVTDCPLRPVEGDPKKYALNDTGRIYQMPCGHGTVYMQEKCACVPGAGDPSVGMHCRPTVHIDFNNDKVKNNNQMTHVDIRNINSTNNFGRFVRGSRAKVEFYKGNGGVFYQLFIELRFYDSNRYVDGRLRGPDAQVLVSNCKTRQGAALSPSIAIVMLPATQTLTFVGITDTETASFNIPYERKGWNNVLLRYDGGELYGEVTYQQQDAGKKLKTNRQSKPLSGKIKTSPVEGLSVGSCSETDYFDGYMDEIWIFDCIPQTQQFPSAYEPGT